MKTPKLLLDRLPADFHARLENWGDVMRDRSRPAVSPTYQICRDLARRAGQTRNMENEPVREWNEPDAEFIEGCWRLAAGYRGLPRETAMLRAYYVLLQPPHIICRFQGVRAREFDDVIVRAVVEFEHFVARIQNRRHNPPQSVQTTV
ncbi:hypothetical protein BBB39_09140 [Bordetella trematum]|uniref:Phage protein n=1 Tax=Bordetella trematum TaxID=123899 RepID=A0A157QBC0_9BORD|nr:hypothetical protein [Bordetella trematum]AZR93916.1 hypothetical protein BBB39_09140 [Bordetella trematum]NNH19048.1 hypothetical protein [Bordetella trematum]SAI42928.1 Uncharacterised protein [Bordetella trematum]SAI72203.1 Uncharacterised protein [Bordetella trematum]SUV97934.1 Uncharacterised protein [Bordetella trematum]